MQVAENLIELKGLGLGINWILIWTADVWVRNNTMEIAGILEVKIVFHWNL